MLDHDRFLGGHVGLACREIRLGDLVLANEVYQGQRGDLHVNSIPRDDARVQRNIREGRDGRDGLCWGDYVVDDLRDRGDLLGGLGIVRDDLSVELGDRVLRDSDLHCLGGVGVVLVLPLGKAGVTHAEGHDPQKVRQYPMAPIKTR